MKALYNKQHCHDEFQQLHKDDVVEKEEQEAAATLADLEQKMKDKVDGILQGVDYAAVAGAWDHGNSETFKKFDEFLHEHPELPEDDKYPPTSPGILIPCCTFIPC